MYLFKLLFETLSYKYFLKRQIDIDNRRTRLISKYRNLIVLKWSYYYTYVRQRIFYFPYNFLFFQTFLNKKGVFILKWRWWYVWYPCYVMSLSYPVPVYIVSFTFIHYPFINFYTFLHCWWEIILANTFKVFWSNPSAN